MKTLVIIPTYNERDNIAEIIRAIHTHAPQVDVLVVDDGSPDGTGQLVRTIGETDGRVSVLQRAGKLGLGTAYIEGFRHALRDGYECVVGMDADFSHEPAALPQFLAAAEHCDLVIGSRYIPGGSTPNWQLHRRMISRCGNWLARTVLELPVRDCTTGYKCYRRAALAALDLDSIDVIGYSFLIETTRQCVAAGLRVREIPIMFPDRREGQSKMSGTIAVEAFRYIFRQSWKPNLAPALPDPDPHAGPASRTSQFLATLAVLIYAALIAIRIPDILLKGRFWAEESAVYLRAARLQPWPEALFLPHAGYLNFAASGATLAATAVPLEYAPWVTSGIALLIQLLPPILLLTGRIPFLHKPWRMAAALVLLLTVQNSAENWLSCITSQYHLGLCVALILAMPTRGGPVGILRAVVLVLAPMSGPAASFLAPLFLVRAWVDRSWSRFVQTVLLGVPTLVQVAMTVLHREPGRPFGIDPQTLAITIHVKHVLVPFLGPIHAEAMAGPIIEAVQAGHVPWVPIMAPVGIAAAFLWGAWVSRDATLRWLLTAATMIMMVSYFGALGPHELLRHAMFGGRYAFIPSSLFALAALGMALTPTRFLRLPFAVACVWMAIAGAVNYRQVDRMFAEGPAWPDEVAKLRADPTYRPQPWPNDPGWKWRIGPAN